VEFHSLCVGLITATGVADLARSTCRSFEEHTMDFVIAAWVTATSIVLAAAAFVGGYLISASILTAARFRESY
jgi:hypothetical protein